MNTFIYGVVSTLIFIIISYVIKIKYTDKLRSFMVVLHSALVILIVYPIFSELNWNGDIWLISVFYEVMLIGYTFTIYKKNMQMKKIYNILGKSQFIVLFLVKYYSLTEIQINKIADELEKLFYRECKFNTNGNMVIIGNDQTNGNVWNCTFSFINLEDFNEFSKAKENILFKDINYCKNGAYFTIKIGILDDNLKLE